MKNICVISGRYPATSFKSYVNHKAYCQRHGYTYICCSWPTGAENPYMNKIRYIKSYISKFDYVFWIDDDAFFIDREQRLESILPSSESFMSVCKSPSRKVLKTCLSSGQFMLRSSPTSLAFLESVENTDLAMVKRWWKPEHGFFTNGDQDAMVYHLNTDVRFAGVDYYPADSFNSRIEDLSEGRRVFVLHLTGTKKVKNASLAQAKKILGCGDTLLSLDECDQLKISSGQSSLVYRMLRRLDKWMNFKW